MNAPEWDVFCESSPNGTVFHTRRFLDYHPPGRWRWDHGVLSAEPGGEPLALWPAAAVDDGATWWSGAGASLGGPVLRAGAGAKDAEAAVRALIAAARERGYRRLRTTPPPPLYESGAAAGTLRSALVAAGFRAVRTEVAQAAPLDTEPSTLLAESARRGAAKAEREGVVVEESEAWEEFHALLVRDRAEIGAAPIHSLPELRDLAGRLGDAQLLLVARRDGTMIAGSWSFAVNGRVALSFYPCQDREQRRLRPMSLLMLRAMEQARARGLAHFDFGTSSIDGVVNPGLFTFKERHGGVAFERETFELA